jgi:hypothetical protein
MFWREYFKTRKNLKIFNFPWKIVRGEIPRNLSFFSTKLSNLRKLILGILKINKLIFETFLVGTF